MSAAAGWSFDRRPGISTMTDLAGYWALKSACWGGDRREREDSFPDWGFSCSKRPPGHLRTGPGSVGAVKQPAVLMAEPKALLGETITRV